MTEFDVLKCIIDSADNTLKCSATDISTELHISEMDLLPYLEILKDNGCISIYLGGEIKLHNKGIKTMSDFKKAQKFLRKQKVLKSFNRFLKWFFGILSGVITALVIWYFGLK